MYCFSILKILLKTKIFLQEKAADTTKQKEEKRLSQRTGRLRLPKVLISYTFAHKGPWARYVRELKESEWEGCVSCARAKAKGGRLLCAAASYIGITHVRALPL
jgi:hypothetical protein